MSGVLDEDMADYWFEQAYRIAARALALDPSNVDAQRVAATVLAERDRGDQAWEIVRDWPENLAPCFEFVRAEVAFRRRDRDACREAAVRIRERGVALPDWLAELVAMSGDGHIEGTGEVAPWS